MAVDVEECVDKMAEWIANYSKAYNCSSKLHFFHTIDISL